MNAKNDRRPEFTQAIPHPHEPSISRGVLHRCALALLPATTPAQSPLKTESFDRDPGWETNNNRIELAKVPVVKQDFGYSATSLASAVKGEIGGRVQRSTRPAMYALKIAPKTLDDKLSASGTFAITASQPGAGLFFGLSMRSSLAAAGGPLVRSGSTSISRGKAGDSPRGSSRPPTNPAAPSSRRICRGNIAPPR